MGLLGNISPEGTIAIGIIVGVLSTAIQSLGLTLQRQSHLLEDEKDAAEPRTPPYKRPRWQAGMFMFITSNLIGSTIQITTLPLPVLSALQAAGLVFNTAFATVLLKEPFTRFSLVGTILTCTGAALIAVFGAVAEPAHSLTQLLILLNRRGFITWMVMTMVVAAGTLVFAHFLKVYSSHKHMSKHLPKNERQRSNSKPDISIDTHRARRLSITAQLPRPLQIRVGRFKIIRGLSYALVSGILSAHSLLVAKSAVELIVRTIADHDNQFNRFQSWLILLALVFFALSQLYYLHLGLRLCSTSVLYPFVFCIYNIVAILDGLIYFRQASRLSVLNGVLVAVGTVILLSGVLALSWRLDDTTPQEPAPQLVSPQTLFAPGMGMLPSPDDVEGSFPAISLSRASTAPAHASERTPLLGRSARRMTLTRNTASPGRNAAQDVWAELDDDEGTYDFLASLPRMASPHMSPNPSLSIPKRRRRASLPAKDDTPSGLVRSGGGGKPRSQTLQTYSRDRANHAATMLESALPSTSEDGETTTEPPSIGISVGGGSGGNRKVSHERRGFSVRFEEENLRTTSPRRSRFDSGGPPLVPSPATAPAALDGGISKKISSAESFAESGDGQKSKEPG